MRKGKAVRYRELSAERVTDWLDAGFRRRDFFPHRAFYLHKAAPDGYKLAVRSQLRPGHGQHWEVVLFALAPALEGLPSDLFFDDEILWHRQHFGLEGQVATASVLERGGELYTAIHQSDLVQRIGRRREYKTRVENRFKGWDRLLLNSILGFALEHDIATVNVPTAEYARRQTDSARRVEEELFDRIYDRHVRDNYQVRSNGNWWAIDVAPNRGRIVLGEKVVVSRPRTKTICLCHDIERGLGHRQVEPQFAESADAISGASLAAMLDVERVLGVRATYNVVGTLLPDVREPIALGGHCLGFHTFDHHLEPRGRWRSLARRVAVGHARDGVPPNLQLGRCRTLDYRIKGYRPAQSRIGADTDDERLAHHNFEWLASSARSLGFERPRIENGIVKIPIRFDDFSLHESVPYEQWEARALDLARETDFLAFSLHDCYADRWLERYPALIGCLLEMGEFKTLDAIAAEVTLDDAA
jgi:hypothetical protein